ncbi:hypothetical protein JKF63_03561 [Porcisia hertigi]|uniref:Uncharacterized protein n=1 Tax=Porcisia hertigi TaxID=2761500 RepID=A0A836LGV7_9TRYP|nr:hypothetical protein JKF63_03561 [Porcisia hertigi]
MFDDVSSFSGDEHVDVNDMQYNSRPPPITLSAQHVDPAARGVPASVAGPTGRIDRYDGTNDLELKSESESEHRAESGGVGEEKAGPLTVVVRADASSPSIETAGSAAQPTPATALKPPAECAGIEAAVSPPRIVTDGVSARDDLRHNHSPSAARSTAKGRSGAASPAALPADASPARNGEREEVGAAASRTLGKRGERQSAGSRAGEFDDDEMQDQFSPSSMNRGTAVRPEYFRSGNSARASAPTNLLQEPRKADADCSLASYIFPRLDPSLAYHPGSRAAATSTKGDGVMPPNVVERGCAYLMVADIRVSSYLCMLFLSLVLLIASIPTSQLDVGEKACLTYWGYKEDCDGAAYKLRRAFYPCTSVRDNLGAGAAFSIITLFVYLANLAAVAVVVCCFREASHNVFSRSRIVVGSLGCVGVVTQLISWVVVTVIHKARPCSMMGLVYGVGFGLNLTSWVLNLLGVAALFAIPSSLANRHQHCR